RRVGQGGGARGATTAGVQGGGQGQRRRVLIVRREPVRGVDRAKPCEGEIARDWHRRRLYLGCLHTWRPPVEQKNPQTRTNQPESGFHRPSPFEIIVSLQPRRLLDVPDLVSRAVPGACAAQGLTPPA